MIKLTEEMFQSGKPFAQGEVLLWMKKYAPQCVLDAVDSITFKVHELEDSKLILGHSETGHHHVLEPMDETDFIGDIVEAKEDARDANFMTLVVNKPCKLIHMRSNDTHEGFSIPAGEYIRRLREESTVDGWVKVSD